MKQAGTIACVLCLVAAAVHPAAGQQLPPRDVVPSVGPATGGITGVVTAADTGSPLRGVDIRVSGGSIPSLQPRWALTDGDGRYEIGGLPPGQYTLSAQKAGYLRLSYGQTRAVEGVRPVRVAASQVLENIDFALPRGAVIVARIVDQFGAPVAGYNVRGYQPRFSGRERTLAPTAGDVLQVTDDRGEFRLFGLAPGAYYIGARPGLSVAFLAGRRTEPQTFYPGTASESEAQPVTVGLGEEVSIFFQLASSRLARISGVIAADPLSTPSVSMIRRSLGSSTGHQITVAADGSFTATGLPPAIYDISARGTTESGTLRVQVSGEDIDGLVLTMRPAATLRGRFTFAPDAPAAGWPASAQFRAIPEGTGISSLATVNDDRTFEIAGVMGTGVLRFSPPPAGWFIQTVMLDGEDVTDIATDFNAFEGKRLDVRLTQRPTQVTGRVFDARNQRANDYVAVVFSEDPNRWTARSLSIAAARPDQEGRFLFRGLPAGRYLIAAVQYLEPGQERDPSTLERLRRGATSLTLGDGESVTGDLQLTP